MTAKTQVVEDIKTVCAECPIALGCEVPPLSVLCLRQLQDTINQSLKPMKEIYMATVQRILADALELKIGVEGFYKDSYTDKHGKPRVVLYDGQTDRQVIDTDPDSMKTIIEVLEKRGFVVV